MKKYLFKWILVTLALVGILILFFIFKTNKNNKACNLVDVAFVNTHHPFLSEKMILDDLRADHIEFMGLPTHKIDLSRMEHSISKNPFILRVDCYFGLDGSLKIDLSQRTPILRVQPIGKLGYYLDEEGKQFPLSPLYSANVKVATGHINQGLNKKLYTFTTYVNQSSFWNSFIEQIFVRPNKELVFTTQIGGHEVIIGDNARLEQKLEKLQKFYSKASSNIGWEVYREINLKFKDQVICRK